MNARLLRNRRKYRDDFIGHSGTSSIHSQTLSAPIPSGLRDAVEAERPALLDLWVRAWAAAMPEIEFEARRPWLDRHLDTLLGAGARMLVADAGGTPAGFVAMDPGRGYLDQLAVDPSHQGSGIAGRLIAGAKALSPERLHLDVNATNARARRFYARHGFVLVSEGVNPRSGLPTLLLLWSNREESLIKNPEI